MLINVYSTMQYNSFIRQACKRIAGEPYWTAHSPRSGSATLRVLAGDPFSEIREDGRWVSDKNLRVYLDTLAAQGLATQPDIERARAWAANIHDTFDKWWSRL